MTVGAKWTGQTNTVPKTSESVPSDFHHYFFSPRNDKNIKFGEDKSGVPFAVKVLKLDSPDGGILLEAGIETSILYAVIAEGDRIY